NTIGESDIDEDLGSGGAMVLPNIEDSAGRAHELVIGAGKDKHIYVADRKNMGKFNPNNNNQLYQDVNGSLAGGVFSTPAFANQKVYFGAVNDSIKVFAFDSNGKLNPTPQSMTSTLFHYPGATPSISGSTKANLILWATEHSSPVILHAYNANDLSIELYNSSQAAHGRDHVGKGNKFVTPTIANGKVYVPTQTGVGVFGLLP